MGSRALWFVVACGLALAGACNESKPTPPAPPPPTVLVAPVLRRDVALFIESVATIDGYVNAEIRARVRGYLQSQKFRDGAQVKEGDLLFTIDPSEFVTAVAQARANVQRAEASQNLNKVQLQRSESLVNSGAVNRSELDTATAAAGVSVGDVGATRAALQQAALNLSYTQVRSPVTGTAGIAQVRIGNLVGQDGPTLLTTVSQVDVMRVTFPISEIDYVRAPGELRGTEGHDLAWAKKQFGALDAGGAVEGGSKGVELLLADGSVYKHRGVIVATNRAVDASTGTLQFEALFPNPESLLRPGQYGRVRVRRNDAGAGSLVVPEKALIQVQGTTSLAVVGGDNKVQMRRVDTGPASQGVRVITGGVQEGDRVVVEGVQKVSDGATVVPQPAPAASAPASAAPGAPGAPGGAGSVTR